MSIKHMVFVEWKDGTDDAIIDGFSSAVNAFPGQIDGVESVEFGKNFTDRAGNFTHCGVVTLRDKDALAGYGPHEAHQAALAVAMPAVANIIVADIET
ncbi:MAG: hypothetical protein GKS02_12635 [Alphaproteobacteria bacterium]|nr:hypothetical protein [Alphaproteobacteria bacterium]